MAKRHNVVTVRYRVLVYADVDLKTGQVVRVVQDDESVRLDTELPDGHEDAPLAVVEASYMDDPFGAEGPKITATVAAKAVHVAEMAEWPSWERS